MKDNISKINKKESEGKVEGLKELFFYAKKYRKPIIVAIVLAILSSVLLIIGPNQLSKITDLIVEGMNSTINLKLISKIGVSLVVLYILSSVFSYIEGLIVTTSVQNFSKDLRTDISKKINRLPLNYFDTHTHGDTLSRVTNDVDMLSQSLNESIGTFVHSSALFLSALVMMLWTNVTMTAVALLSTAVGFLLMIFIINRSQKYFYILQSEIGSINGFIEEMYSGHNVVKVYNAEREVIDSFDEINEEIFNSIWKAQFLSGIMQPLMSFIGNIGYVAVSLTGAVLVINGSIGFGTIIAFMIYIRLFTQPLSQIAQAFTSLQSAGAASKRVFEFLNEEELLDESNKTKKLEAVKGEVEFENIRFGYSDDKIIINDFSAKANPGEKIAIVGPTGAGKTTMVNLLMKFYEINDGDIKIDGVPISDMTREEVHDQFCMVLQDTWLFEGTVKENIVYSEEGILDEEVVKALKTVGMHDFVMSLPEGYETVLDDSVSISEGEKQLLTIARALVKDAPMLILDEATSSVDTRTEKLIQGAMDKLMEGRTSFVIAHRLSTIKNSDLILVLKDGDIIEKGTHDDLMMRNGFYAGLYNSQFDEVAA